MADPVATELIRDTGYIYWNPVRQSNLGTQLGYVEDGIQLFANYKVTPIFSEINGLTPEFFIYSGEDKILSMTLQSNKEAVLQRVFLQTVSGVGVSLPGTLVAGTKILPGTYQGSFIFIPENSSHFCWYSSACVGYMGPQGGHYQYGKLLSWPILLRCLDLKQDLIGNILSA